MPKRESKARPRPHLRSTIDSVMIHDMKNVGYRLNLLLSNIEEHYGDPDFKRSVEELLLSTLDKIETIVGHWSEYRDGILVKISLDINAVLNDLINVPGRPIRGNRTGNMPRVEVDFSRISPVWGDPHYLRDAFSSLIQNALEAAASAGSVVVVSTREEQRGNRRWVVVEISDDGDGIPEEIQGRLFTPFQTTKSDGVGLGLYTARQILRFHRGTIEIDSEPGSGTMVRVRLPATRRGAG